MYLLILFLPFYFTVTGFQSGGTEIETLPSHEKLMIRIQKSLEAISIVEKELLKLKEDLAILGKEDQGGRIQARWEAEVIPVCRTIETRFPFSQYDAADSSLEDVSHFFHPRDGILWKFYNEELRPHIVEGQDKWQVKTYQDQAELPLTPKSLEWLRTARFISESLFTSGFPTPRVAFSLYPHPDQGPSAMFVARTMLKIGSQELIYEMGPQRWQDLLWPGQSGSMGTKLNVQINGIWETLEFRGWWGWFRLLETAQIIPMNDSTFKVLWEIDGQTGRPLRIRYDLKLASSRNPFIPGTFSMFSCLESLW